MMEEAAKEQEMLASLGDDLPTVKSESVPETTVSEPEIEKEQEQEPIVEFSTEVFVGDDNIAYDGEDMLPVVVVNRVVPVRPRAIHQEISKEASLAPLSKTSGTKKTTVEERPQLVQTKKHRYPLVPGYDDEEIAKLKEEENTASMLKEEEESIWEPEIVPEEALKKEEPVQEQPSPSIPLSNPSMKNEGVIKGDIHLPKGGEISATVYGEVTSKGCFSLTGEIFGKVEAEDVILNGIIHGSLKCNHLTLSSRNSKIEGNLSVDSLSIDF